MPDQEQEPAPPPEVNPEWLLKEFNKLLKDVPQDFKSASDEEKWRRIASEVSLRKELVLLSKKRLQNQLSDDTDDCDSLVLAATDIFVEKAQDVLTIRAKSLQWWGRGTALAALLVLAGAAVFAYIHVGKWIEKTSQLDSEGYIILAVQILSAGAFGAAVAHWLIVLSRAHFHEAMELFKRRHSLRFGRLAVYSQRGRVSIEQLISAFKWTEEFSSAFRDIKPEKISRSLVQTLVEGSTEITKAAASLASAGRRSDTRSQ